MTRFVRSWFCAAALALSTLAAAGPAAADPVTDARAAWQAQVAKAGAESAEALGAEWDLAQALTNAGDLAGAEPHWRDMAAAAERLFPGDAELRGQLQIRLAMNVIQQGRYAEGAALAEAALPAATAAMGADSELVGLGQAALATAYMLMGDFARAEAPGRAAYESAMSRDGGARAGPYAMLLQQIYAALGREDEGRAVMALTNPEGVDYSARQHELTVYRESGDWRRLAGAARRYAADWRAETGDVLALQLAQEAEIDLADALLDAARAGAPASFDEASAAISRVNAEHAADGASGWSRARGLNTEADLYLFWPGHEDYDRATRLKGLALTALEADIGPDHPQALSQRLTYGVLLLQSDPQAAAPVLGAYYDAALNGLVPPDEWAAAAGLLGGILAEADPAMGYHLTAGAAEGLTAYALAPERAAGGRRVLRRHDALFRTQVDLAWGLSESLR